MNIAVVTAADNYYFRPDTTLNREAKDYYCPDGITRLLVTPCVYSRIVKPAKAISKKFIDRYIDSFDFGFILDACAAQHGVATSMDYTTVFPCDFKKLSTADDASFELSVNSEVVFSSKGFDKDSLSEAVVSLSARSSLRFGDLVAIPLSTGYIAKIGDRISFCGREITIF
ncbi:MAG: hypothetical protein IJS02_02310 [Bacteroidales bacterium]|nr:hypothetical protein [Bacteroidales bacterium]